MSFFSSKDPSEIVTVAFDFAQLTVTPSNPNVVISVAKGEADPAVNAMLEGSPGVSGSRILQRVINGIDKNVYELKCSIDAPDGSHYVISAYLPIYET